MGLRESCLKWGGKGGSLRNLFKKNLKCKGRNSSK